jgi:hypothetical protein
MGIDLEKILDHHKNIRFIAKISYDGDFVDYIHREDLDLELTEKQKTRMGAHVSILVDNHRKIDNLSGKAAMTFTLRPKIVSGIIYSDEWIFSISIDRDENYSSLIDSISDLVCKHVT